MAPQSTHQISYTIGWHSLVIELSPAGVLGLKFVGNPGAATVTWFCWGAIVVVVVVATRDVLLMVAAPTDPHDAITSAANEIAPMANGLRLIACLMN